LGHEDYWDLVLWKTLGPVLLVCLLVLAAWIFLRPPPIDSQGDLFPRAYQMIWLVLVLQNLIAQLITGPWTVWSEAVFSIYYLLLFALTGVIIRHFHRLKALQFKQNLR
jgi:hypothetical protein